MLSVLMPLALLVEQIPMLLFGLPLVAASSLVFAATHHESPAAIGRAALEWLAWLGGILGVVLLVVLILGAL